MYLKQDSYKSGSSNIELEDTEMINFRKVKIFPFHLHTKNMKRRLTNTITLKHFCVYLIL